MSDPKTSEQLRAEYESIRATNPFVAARFAREHRIHAAPAPTAAPTAFPSGDHKARLAQLRPSGDAASTVDLAPLSPEDQAIAEVAKTNPFIAARMRHSR